MFIVTDHKPLTYAFKSKPDRYSPREIRHIDYISQFSTDIRHIKGSENKVADALSRYNVNMLSHFNNKIDFDLITTKQKTDPELLKLRDSSGLHLEEVPIPTSHNTIICDTSTGHPRPYIPLEYRRDIFQSLHDLSHPGIRAILSN